MVVMRKISRKIGNMNWKLKRAWTLMLGVFEYNILSHIKTLPPKEMIINITYWCNSRCVMCNIWKMKPKNELSLEEWQRILDDKIFESIEVVSISGGEPTMNKDFLDLIEVIMDSMPKLYKLNLITNGFTPKFILKKVEALAKMCDKRGIHLNVSVSVDGIGKMHEKIRGIKNGFEKTIQTLEGVIELSKKYNISYGSGSMVLRQTLDHIDEVKQWYKKRKIPLNLQLVGFHKTFVNNLAKRQEIDFIKKQNNKLIRVIKKIIKGLSLRDFQLYYWRDMIGMYRDGKPRTTPCPFLKDQFVLDSFGDVYYCLSEPKIGNVRKGKTVSDVYYDPKNLEYRKNLPKRACKGCNSGCNASYAIAKDLKKYLWFKLTGKPWYGWKEIWK